MERNEILLRLQKEFDSHAPNVRRICELFVQLGMELDLKKCHYLTDLKQLWSNVKDAEKEKSGNPI